MLKKILQATRQAGSRQQAVRSSEDDASSSLATPDDILACFRLILGRKPNPEELEGHLSHAGRELSTVVSTYLNSLEFANRRLIGIQLNTSYAIKDTGLFHLLVNTEDEDVGKHVFAGEYEPHVTSVFNSILRRDMHAVDIGANIGYFSMLAASLVGPGGSVIAFEPNPDNAKMLEFSRRHNDFEQLRLYQMAASDSDGILALHSTYSNGTTSQPSDELETLLQTRTVPCLQIDKILLSTERVDLIKIDVEGAEYRALKGAEALIQRDRPVIVSEFSPAAMPGISGVEGTVYLRFLVEMGYGLEVLLSTGQKLDCAHDIQQVMNAYEQSGVDHIDFMATMR